MSALSQRPYAAIALLAFIAALFLPFDLRNVSAEVAAESPLVTPTQYQPLRPYQEYVRVGPGGNSGNAVFADFAIPPDFHLVVEQIFVNVMVPNGDRFIARLTAMFGGQNISIDLDARSAVDISNGYQSYIFNSPLRLFAEDRGTNADLRIIALGNSAPQGWFLEATVVGHLVPSLPPR